MNTATLQEVNKNFRLYFDRVVGDIDTIVVNDNGDESAILISLTEYNSLMETLHLMSSNETMDDIRQAEKDLRAGKGIEVNIDEL